MHEDAILNTSAGGFFPGLVTAKFYETWDFYTERLGFSTLDESDRHVLLLHPSGTRLEILRHETDERHAELVSATDGHGFWFTLEVMGVEVEYQRLCEAGVQLVQPLEISSQGRRSFALRDPNGVLICVASRHDASSQAALAGSFEVG